MKKLFSLLIICAWTAMPFVLSSCSDDDEGDNLLTPARAVSDLSFIDKDNGVGTIGGTLTWTLPSDETYIEDYVIYVGEDESSRTTKVGEVTKGTTSFEIPEGTAYLAYLIVVARNDAGESSNAASLSINDYDGNPIVSNLSFTDTDNTYYKIGGTLTWTPDSTVETTGYVIYAGANASTLGDKIGEADANDSSFVVPAGTAYSPFLHVVIVTADGESTSSLAISVTDVFTKAGVYILNGGNWNENNASLSYYDYKTGEITTDVYQTANGKGLGDTAEQLLIYGSKIYITVTGSNRIAVLDMDAKELKSITPADSDPMSPRCMAADNGKIYVSYYYGHSVAVLDTASLSIEKTIPVGRYPEQLAVSNGKIYVANSGGYDFPNYSNTVSVINESSLSVEKDIEVIVNPVQIAADSQGDIYVISWGDHGETIDHTLQRIDAHTGEVGTLGKATKMTIVDDKIYTYLYQYYNNPGISYVKYNALTENVIDDAFIADNTFTSYPNAIAVDPSGKIFITSFDYSSISTMYLFSTGGQSEKSIDTGGYDAKWMDFVVR